MGKARRDVDPVGETGAEDAALAEADGPALALSEDEVEDDAEVEPEVAVAVTRRGRSCRDDSVEAHTVASRAHIREQMARDIESFLAGGGRIQVIESEGVGDAPRKPVIGYGNNTPL